MSGRVFLDSNIFIYAMIGHHEFGEMSREVLSRSKNTQLVSSELVMAEVLSYKELDELQIVDQTQNQMENMDIEYMPITKDICLFAAGLRRERPSLRMPDAIVIASAVLSKCRTIVTNDLKLASISPVRGVQVKGLSDYFASAGSVK
jgi:predicted nucleic acid-binding protein